MKIVPGVNRSMHPNYGIDAPNLVKAFMAIGIAGCVLAVALGFGSNAGLPTWLRYRDSRRYHNGCLVSAHSGRDALGQQGR